MVTVTDSNRLDGQAAIVPGAAPGQERVLVAGQPEAEVEAVRRVDGIPFHPEVIQWIRDTCGELSVPCLV